MLLDFANRYARLSSFFRYYQAALANTLFGYGIYALFVALGANIFVAQIGGHIMGTVFNYFSYSRYVFRKGQASKLRFGAAYVGNYLVGLIALAILSRVISSAYFAGLAALVTASAVNYVVLNRLVFRAAA